MVAGLGVRDILNVVLKIVRGYARLQAFGHSNTMSSGNVNEVDRQRLEKQELKGEEESIM